MALHRVNLPVLRGAAGLALILMRGTKQSVAATPNRDAAWDERRNVYRTSDLIVDTLSITAAAEGAPRGNWTCVVAAAVFRFTRP